MSDDDGFVHPPPSAERYFNIARGDDPTWDNMPNGPDAVTAFALLSIAKSLIDLTKLLEIEILEGRDNG